MIDIHPLNLVLLIHTKTKVPKTPERCNMDKTYSIKGVPEDIARLKALYRMMFLDQEITVKQSESPYEPVKTVTLSLGRRSKFISETDSHKFPLGNFERRCGKDRRGFNFQEGKSFETERRSWLIPASQYWASDTQRLHALSNLKSIQDLTWFGY